MRHLKLLAATGFTAAVLAAGATSDTAGSIARFRLVERSHSTLGQFSGSTETWQMSVLLVHATKVIGTGVITCTQIRNGSPLRQCQATYLLPEGQLELQGLISSERSYTMLITAASGVYQGAEGSASTQRVGRAPWSALITFYFT